MYEERHTKTILAAFFFSIPVKPGQLSSGDLLYSSHARHAEEAAAPLGNGRSFGKVRTWERETEEALRLPLAHPGRGQQFRPHLQ